MMIDNKLLIVLNKVKTNDNIKKQIIGIIILVACFIIINDYKLYILLNNIIVIATIIAFNYVNIMKRKNMDKTFTKKVEIIDIVSITMVILNIIEIRFCFAKVISYWFLILYSLQVSLEYCQIDNIFEFSRNTLKSILVYLSYGGILVISVVLFRKYDGISMEYQSLLIILANSLISFFIGISTLKNLFKNRHYFRKTELKRILFYMISIVSNCIVLIVISIGNEKLVEILIALKCIMFYDFYDYIIKKLLNNSLEEINKNIKVASKAKKELNVILINRSTILKETKVMFQKSQNNCNEVLDSIYGGVFLFFSNRLKYVNKRMLKILNVEKQEILGIDLEKFISRYFDINLRDIEQLENYISCAKMKEHNFDVEIFLSKIGYETKLFYLNNITETNENRKAIKEMEEYLKEDELKRKFFANISHELKTPINLIFSALQVNKLYLKENNMKGIKNNEKVIKKNSLRLIRTINNFIDANKLSNGYIISNCKIYNIVEIVENVSIGCNKYIKLIKNTLTFDSDNEEIYVDCDKEMITRIMLNILSNSVKYGKENGHINVNIYIENDDDVTIKVKNDGMKIDEKTIPYIFDKFTKLNKAFNRIKEGSGLGMFLTKGLVELQGGRIKLISNDDGNEFIITIPRVKDVKEIELHEELEINPLEEKVDVEFSDIYIE